MLLSGCSAKFDSSYNKQCLVSYKLHTFREKNVVLQVDKQRRDRFGQVSVHIKRNLNVKFLGSGWLKSGDYTNINCDD